MRLIIKISLGKPILKFISGGALNDIVNSAFLQGALMIESGHLNYSKFKESKAKEFKLTR